MRIYNFSIEMGIKEKRKIFVSFERIMVGLVIKRVVLVLVFSLISRVIWFRFILEFYLSNNLNWINYRGELIEIMCKILRVYVYIYF